MYRNIEYILHQPDIYKQVIVSGDNGFKCISRFCHFLCTRVSADGVISIRVNKNKRNLIIFQLKSPLKLDSLFHLRIVLSHS